MIDELASLALYAVAIAVVVAMAVIGAATAS